MKLDCLFTFTKDQRDEMLDSKFKEARRNARYTNCFLLAHLIILNLSLYVGYKFDSVAAFFVSLASTYGVLRYHNMLQMFYAYESLKFNCPAVPKILSHCNAVKRRSMIKVMEDVK